MDISSKELILQPKKKRVLPVYRRHSAALGLCMLLLTLGGCASTPEPPSSDMRTQLGRIGVLALPSTPRVEFKTFAKGWAAGVAKGGAFGAFEGILSSLTEVLRNPPSGPYALPAILITAVVVTTTHTAVYGFAGGLEAVPGKTAAQIEEQLDASIGDINLTNDLAKEIHNVSASRPDLSAHRIKHLGSSAPGIHVLYTEVHSVQPLLNWEGFPRLRDRKESNLPLLNKISDVTYDLKIWEAINDYPERLVYDRTGLLESQHRPIVPLKPNTKYFWTFRARYKLTGQSQVTRWAFSSIPSNAPSDYPVRRPGGICDLDAIPSTNYFRFITLDK